MGNTPTEEDRQAPGEPSARRFLILDAMVLILASAVMLSARSAFRWSWTAGNPFLSYGEREVTRYSAALALVGLSFVLLPFTLARKGDRRRLRQGAPGLLVYLVVVVTFGWMLIEYAMRWMVMAKIWGNFGYKPFHPLATALISIVLQFGMPMSIGVAIAWITLAIVGRWRPDRGWDDRLGRLVGCLWLVYGPGESLVTALMAYWG
jgi:hypothetical protein